MRKFILIASLALSTSVLAAENYLVYQINQGVRVVLAKKPCLVPSLQGNAASVQTITGKYIQGCWHVDRNNSDHIRIDWNNPAAPGDFSVLPLASFTAVNE